MEVSRACSGLSYLGSNRRRAIWELCDLGQVIEYFQASVSLSVKRSNKNTFYLSVLL